MSALPTSFWRIVRTSSGPKSTNIFANFRNWKLRKCNNKRIRRQKLSRNLNPNISWHSPFKGNLKFFSHLFYREEEEMIGWKYLILTVEKIWLVRIYCSLSLLKNNTYRWKSWDHNNLISNLSARQWLVKLTILIIMHYAIFRPSDERYTGR
jgi:hypothetical protein